MTTTIHPGLTALLCLPAQGEGAFTWPDADNPELLATPAGLELALDRGTDETERQGRRAAVLLGEAGAGKSHVLNSLAAAASNSFGLPAIAVDLSSSREPIGLLDDLVGDGVVPSLFLLDNLDAIENPDLRRRFCQALEDAVEREEGSRWLIASRLATWEHGIHLLRRGLEFHLRPLDDGAMHAAAARHFEQLGAAHQTQAFLDALTAPAFRLRAAAWLARNPRRLQVLTLAWARELTLPTDPEGFEQLVEALQPELGFDDRELAGTREWRELGDDAVCDADLSSQCHIETRSRVRLRSLGPGRFTMGSPDSEEGRWADEGPVRDVDVAAFELGVHPVTNSEYERFVVADPEAELPAYWGDPRFNKDHQPVVGVSWAQAHAFAAWA
ncbi:MAG: SUMF1/EgtB/PvdO family nonheme iron enzyme, partial [Acidimicrobiales bacterium]